MSISRLLLDDEGAISRREWWIGAIALVVIHMAAGWLANRYLGRTGFDRPLMLFVSIVMLIPFHAINAKRFRFLGLPTHLALIGGLIGGASILAGAFLPLAKINIVLGMMLLVTTVVFVTVLGVIDRGQRIDPESGAA